MKKLLLFSCTLFLTTTLLTMTSFYSVGSAAVKDLEPADFVIDDLTRWKNLPVFNLPGFNFERLAVTGRYGSGSGNPNVPSEVELQVISRNGGVSLLGVRHSRKGREDRNYVGSYLGTHTLSTSSSGRSGKWTRRILNMTFVKYVPVDSNIINETPQIHGVSAKELSYELESDIRIGGGSNRTFSITSNVIGTDIVDIKINGKSYQLDSYVIEIVTKNKREVWKRTSTIRYIPALGYRGRSDTFTKWRGGSNRTQYDDFRYEVSNDQLKNLSEFFK